MHAEAHKQPRIPADVDGNLRSRIKPYAEIRSCPYLLFRRGRMSTNVRGNALAFSHLAVNVATD
jgi:hypothetical protein